MVTAKASVLEHVLAAALGPGRYWDADGIPLEGWEWRSLYADADYRRLDRTSFGPEWTGAGWVTITTEWAGTDLRAEPDPDRAPLVWSTRVTGGALDGQVRLAATREVATKVHGHVIGLVCETLGGPQ
ncbi:hypothetical protein ACL02T_33125 [Pseudonocardia sp. RS010]|uniref:hypothetical protein n=1 Tax=Pseudonocardia sp. RS010 TaxID=3385979 RepID=UPI0039A375C3